MLDELLERWLPRKSPKAHALFAAERASDEDETLQARALERAHETLEGERWSGVNLRLPFAHPLLGSRSRGHRAALLVAAPLALVGLAAAGMQLAREAGPVDNTRPPTAAVAHAVAARPSREVQAVAALIPSSEAAPPLRAHSTARVRSNGVNQYVIELGLLEPARSHIAWGDFRAALVAIAKHQREYPNGQLAEEREALRVRALWSLGQRQGAEAAAAAFRKRYPRSALLSWMKRHPAP